MVSALMLALGLIDVFGALLAIAAMRLDALEGVAVFVLSIIILKGLWTLATSWM